MKHLIVGSGVVGVATGTFLEANNFDVTYYDNNNIVRTRLREKGKRVIGNNKSLWFDVIWICVPETCIEDVFDYLPKRLLWDNIVIIRSSTFPGTIRKLKYKYNIPKLYHVPEFLREATSIDDTFNPDRIVIGVAGEDAGWITPIFDSINKPKIIVTSTESEIIKLVSNAWLSTQIAFWNEIKELCDKLEINPQKIANAVTLDKRISSYGSNMLGLPFVGKCLPKDLEQLLDCFKEEDIKSYVLHMVRNKNDYMRFEETINKNKKNIKSK